MQNSPLVFVWENFGPIHADRCEAIAHYCAGKRKVIGIELASRSETYEWHSENRPAFEKLTLFKNTTVSKVGTVTRAWATLKACLASKGQIIFLCHYEHPATFITACILRLLRRTVIVMNDSKFDDYDRFLWREVAKSIMYLPYWGALASGTRAKDYLRFLGIPADRIATNYNTLSIDRIRKLSGSVPAPGGVPFANRHFTIVARFVSKKNLPVALLAYAAYCKLTESPRDLHLCGSGPLESQLRQIVAEKGLEGRVKFHGFVQTAEICRILANTLALLLPSTEEQFGNVVIEAQAMGLPVILSDQCGARDHLVRSGVNGFVVEPHNPDGIAFFMANLSEDEPLWRKMCANVEERVAMGDVSHFIDAVSFLVKKSNNE